VINFDIKNHRDIVNDPKVNVEIKYIEGCFTKNALSVFGGVIESYDSSSALMVVKPFGMGEISPGMLMAYISTMLTVALQLSTSCNIPIEIMRVVAHRAIEDGLSDKNIVLRE